MYRVYANQSGFCKNQIICQFVPIFIKGYTNGYLLKDLE